jgi:hypothetical protein
MTYIVVLLCITGILLGIYLYLGSMMILTWIVGEYERRMKGREEYGFWNFMAGALPVVLSSPFETMSFFIFWPQYDWFQDESI